MLYAADYSNKIKLDNFDQIIIQYDRQNRELLTFLQEHGHQHIVLSVSDIEDFYEAQEWKKLNAIYEQFTNFSIRFFNVKRFELLDDKLKEIISYLKMPFFTGLLVTNFDQLHYLCEQGANSVYLGEDICFDLKRAKRVCDSYGVSIRVFPNVGQCSVKSGPALKKFFIRPEDMQEYSDVIDIIEYWGPTDRQEIIRQIYAKGKWFGDLKELILDFDLSFDSRRIIPGFARMRKACGRKCMKGEVCTICDQVYSISEKLKEKNLIIKQKKNH